jgi:hypothetical protein
VRLTTPQCLDAIERHTRGLAEAAAGHLDAPIEHCPGWSMADLVWHLTDVHWFWNHIADTRPLEEPSELTRPERPSDELLVPGLLSGLDTLAETLRGADQDAPCWTWGLDEHVRFITGHQVQEAAVHHWDALNAIGAVERWGMLPVDAIDAVEEFLTESVGNRRWPVKDAEPMGGRIWFYPSCEDKAPCPQWVIQDGARPGTITFTVDGMDGLADSEGDPTVVGNDVQAPDVLLWLYRRVPDDDPRIFDPAELSAPRRQLVQRFRALTFTD